MTQVIGNVMIIELKPEDKAKSVIEQIVHRYEKQISENVTLRLELERIKEQQRRMVLAFPN
jgi:hypothetical protein